MNTRSLILDARNDLILPSQMDRLTFDNEVDDIDSPVYYEQVQRSMKERYGMWPLLARRSLGDAGINSALLLTPGVGKNPERTFTWRRESVDAVTNRIELPNAAIDEDDLQIYKRFIALTQSGEISL